MATAWRRNPSPSINTRCWKKFNLDLRDYLIRVLTSEDSYEIQMFECENCSVWEESLSGPTLASKVKVKCHASFFLNSVVYVFNIRMHSQYQKSSQKYFSTMH